MFLYKIRTYRLFFFTTTPIRNRVVINLRLSNSHFSKSFFSHYLFLPFILFYL